MITTNQLTQAFARNQSIIQRQTVGLTHADSLRQPPFRGNCLNWVLGHLVDNRDSILGTLGAATVGGEDIKRYAWESEPVLPDDSTALPLDELLRLLASAQETLTAALGQATPESLARTIPQGDGTTTVGQRVFFLYFHETYHVGQTELLRQLAGTDDKII
jgi:uncharacterized damage-inducible protein DinB